MAKHRLNNPLLHRFWFKTKEGFGFGVTAYSIEDALSLLDEIGRPLALEGDVVDIIEDVDIRELDQAHVTPNMGPPNFRGVWYPNLTSS